MWIADIVCQRLLHLFLDGRVTVSAADELSSTAQMARDSAGGVWFAAAGESSRGTPTGPGRSRSRGRNESAPSVAVASDGSAWFALGRCELARVAPDGSTTFHPAPLPAIRAFGPGDTLWLASERRLVRTTLGELSAQGCDGRSPRVTVTPQRASITLAQLHKGIPYAPTNPRW